MYYGLFYSSLALVSLALFSVTGLPIPSPSPHSISHLNYVHGAFSDGNFLQYTVVHPPHPQHTFYNTNQVPMISYTKPLYIYNPFQHHILLVHNNNVQIQHQSEPTEPKPLERNEEEAAPTVGLEQPSSDDTVIAPQENHEQGTAEIKSESHEAKEVALDDTVHIESGDAHTDVGIGDDTEEKEVSGFKAEAEEPTEPESGGDSETKQSSVESESEKEENAENENKTPEAADTDTPEKVEEPEAGAVDSSIGIGKDKTEDEVPRGLDGDYDFTAIQEDEGQADGDEK